MGESQCQYFVVRKKRLCRMTVKRGSNYCAEHKPRPENVTADDTIVEDKRIPCPLDPKHTCYASKLEKHLLICNARPVELPSYIEHGINAPPAQNECPRIPLSLVSKENLEIVVDKINKLYEIHLQNQIEDLPDIPIHDAVRPDFDKSDRTESSLRHLRQVSRLLHIVKDEGLVKPDTCYVELGAGKGQLSYYLGVSYCMGGSRVVCVDRAALRHKRDNRLRNPNFIAESNGTSAAVRIRADLAHLALDKVPAVRDSQHVVGFAKHLCGEATDFALRCVAAAGRCRGAVLATCCHHRCTLAALPASHLEELGFSAEEINIMLGIVSWATCGDGRSRSDRMKKEHDANEDGVINDMENKKDNNYNKNAAEFKTEDHKAERDNHISNNNVDDEDRDVDIDKANSKDINDDRKTIENKNETPPEELLNRNVLKNDSNNLKSNQTMSRKYKEMVGRKAKALIDWGRVLYLREAGFDARLCHYVPTTVSLENVCIVAKKHDVNK